MLKTIYFKKEEFNHKLQKIATKNQLNFLNKKIKIKK